MGLTLGTSTTALRLFYNIGVLESQREVTMTRLSTGKRINQAKDDPTGLVQLASLNADLAEVNVAIENNQRSQSILDTADATLTSIDDLVSAIETAVINAADPTATSAQIAAYQSTVDQSLDAIDSLMSTASYNGTQLFDGAAAEISPTVTDADNLIADEHVYTRDGSAVAAVTITVTFDNAKNLTITDGSTTANYGQVQVGNSISYSMNGYSGSVTITNVQKNKSATIEIGTTGGHTFMIGTDTSNLVVMDMGAGITSDELGDVELGYLSSLRSGQVNDLSSANLDTALAIANEASEQAAVAASRVGNFNDTVIGASLNALEAMKEGTTSAISAIEDTDYAEETARLERQDIMLQAAVSMLSRTSVAQQYILTLLGID